MSRLTSLTSIGKNAFHRCDRLKTVDMSGCTSLTGVGELAFNSCEKLSSVNMSGCTSLVSLGQYAFSGCDNLTSVDMSGCTSLTTISADAFAESTNIHSIKLPDGLLVIDDHSFEDMKLTSISIPASVTAVGEGAFSYWKNSQTITVSGSTASWNARWDYNGNAIVN